MKPVHGGHRHKPPLAKPTNFWGLLSLGLGVRVTVSRESCRTNQTALRFSVETQEEHALSLCLDKNAVGAGVVVVVVVVVGGGGNIHCLCKTKGKSNKKQ